ncbi:MAG: hypothetical protein ACYDCC_01640 [Actinomycetota bacterium]
MLKKEAVSPGQAAKTLNRSVRPVQTVPLPIRMPPVFHIDSTPPAQLSQLAAMCDNVLAKTPVKLQFAGIGQMFHEPRLFRGESSHWVIGPAEADPHLRAGSFAVPGAALVRLKALVKAGIDFPMTYVAHELDNTRVKEFGQKSSELALRDRDAGITISTSEADKLVGALPLPAKPQRKADRLGQLARGVREGATATLTAVGMAAAAPLIAASALTSSLDPMILGAMTADGSNSEGAPAVWFVLAQWDW